MTSKKGKVCHITTVHAWNDIRIFQKECKSLVGFGFDVHLIVPTEELDNLSQDGVQLHPITLPNNRLNRFRSTCKLALQKAKEVDAQIYHIHDPELLPTALELKKLNKLVVYDAHENTAASIYDKEWLPTQLLRTSISKWFDRYESKAVQKLDAVVSVAVPLVERFDNPNKVLIRNLPILDSFENHPLHPDFEEAVPGAVYAGGLTKIRNIKEMIQAVDQSQNIDVLHLFGGWETEGFKAECEALEGWRKVKYWGFRPTKEVYSFIQEKGLLGFILFDPGIKNHKIALPNKAFEYMAARVPIVMSQIPYWKENFSEVAHFVDPFDVKAISNEIDNLIKDEGERARMKNVGQSTVSELNWQAESEKLNKLYTSLLS